MKNKPEHRKKRWPSWLPATRQQVAELGEMLMSVISDYLTKQKAWNDRNDKSVDEIVAGVAGITSDIADLNKTIAELQNSSGGVTPEDQASITELENKGEALAAKGEAVAAALKALDSSHPPVVPPAPV